jgi:hypothetical protein
LSTFEEYQTLAGGLPVSLRNNRDRINLPLQGFQEESGKIGALLTNAFAAGRLELTTMQKDELKARLADTLWYLAILCTETGLAMTDVAAHSLAQLEARRNALDPDQR